MLAVAVTLAAAYGAYRFGPDPDDAVIPVAANACDALRCSRRSRRSRRRRR